MDRAKAAVSDFMAKAGKHDTTVHERVAPAVQHEQVKPTRHENVTTAVDKEIHQDHYHHSVQPVHDREVLPEKHSANLGAVEHRDFDHRDKASVARNLETERAKFKDEQVIHDTRHTQSVQPSVAGEHVHHHVHETIQPIVHKETIQPEVVHTTVPIHEVHHNAAQHHSTSELPAVHMADFKKQGGVLGGREERYDEFKGEPRNIGGALGNIVHKKTDSAHDHHNHSHGQGLTGTSGTARTGELGNGLGRDHHPGGNNFGNTTRSGDLTGAQHSSGDNLGNTSQHTGNTTGQKPSLLNRLNPLSDSDRDGKRGVGE